jgi:hypothetical protein
MFGGNPGFSKKILPQYNVVAVAAAAAAAVVGFCYTLPSPIIFIVRNDSFLLIFRNCCNLPT